MEGFTLAEKGIWCGLNHMRWHVTPIGCDGDTKVLYSDLHIFHCFFHHGSGVLTPLTPLYK